MSAKTTLRALAPLALASLIFTNGCRKTDPFSVTEADMVTEMKENKNYEKLFAYGRQIGIDADTTKYPDQGILNYLEEIGYGHKPGHLAHIEEVLPPDTVALQRAGWELAQGTEVSKALEKLEPPFDAYKALKNHYQRLVGENKPDSAALVAESLNAYRWMHRQSRGAERMVLVNVRGAYLKGLDSLGREDLRMNVIVGKAKTATPGLDTYATDVTTYPYWNVPKSIAVGEMLPKIRENIYYLQRNGIEVLDRKNQVVSEFDIDWDGLSESDFPYRFRQESGEDNSLGFMKINLLNPLAIYLHDTNVRTLFETDQRWRSHGCVRLERPAELANYLAGEKIVEENFIEEALAIPEADRKPKTHKLPRKVPTFLYFLPADVDQAGKLTYYPDVYDLKKPTT